MKTTQDNHFGRESGNDLSWPDFTRIAEAFGIPWTVCPHNDVITSAMLRTIALDGPFLCLLKLSPTQIIAPVVKTKVEDGKFVPVPIEDMWPYLPRDEFAANMDMKNGVDGK
jgi:acetolactate synthase-1/2/3 large subunit